MSLANLLNSAPSTICFHESNPAGMAWTGAEATIHSILNDFENILAGGPRGITIDLMAPHRTDRAEPLRKLATLPEVEAIGDVASYFLPYVETILARAPDTVFPCLKRDRKETIRSFSAKVTARPARISRSDRLKSLLGRGPKARPHQKNHWIQHDGTNWITDLRWDKCFPDYDAPISLDDAIGRYYDDYYTTVDELARKYPRSVNVFDLNALNDQEGQNAVMDFCGITRRPQYIVSHENQGRADAKLD